MNASEPAPILPPNENLHLYLVQGVSLDIENYCTLSLFFVHMRYGRTSPP